ncbi:MAG: Hpt domain-containing protein [Treponema sp.]|nr:Hpt domain-containing protein [Treponema sp.]
MQVLDINQALELVDGETDLLCSLLESFVNTKHFDRTQVESLVAQEKLDQAASYVHYFKGAARQLYAQECAAAGQALEDVLRKRTEGDIPSLTDAFEAAYGRALKAAGQALNSLSQ